MAIGVTKCNVGSKRNHLKFNLRCKELDIILASLNLACLNKTQRARDTVDRAKRGLLRERIGQNVKRYTERIVCVIV